MKILLVLQLPTNTRKTSGELRISILFEKHQQKNMSVMFLCLFPNKEDPFFSTFCSFLGYSMVLVELIECPNSMCEHVRACVMSRSSALCRHFVDGRCGEMLWHATPTLPPVINIKKKCLRSPSLRHSTDFEKQKIEIKFPKSCVNLVLPVTVQLTALVHRNSLCRIGDILLNKKTFVQ